MKWKIALVALGLCSACHAGIVTIEPDDYPDGTQLGGGISGAFLTVTGSDNVPNASLHVTAARDTFNSPTGDNVFAASGVNFWNSTQRMRVDLSVPVSYIAILFAGGKNFATEIGRLDAFNSAGTLVASYATSPLGPQAIEDMVINRGSSDISFFVAYIRDGEGDFGRLDDLRFGSIPEPSSIALFGVGVLALARRRR